MSDSRRMTQSIGFALAFVLLGCSEYGYAHGGSATASFSISGVISPAPSGAGAMLSLRGPRNVTVTTDGSGAYTFTGLPPGSYTITPSAAATTFTPASVPVTISNVSTGPVDFKAASHVVFFDDFSGTALGPEWAVIARHGEYSQQETECNVAQGVSVANGSLSITTAPGPIECGDFNVDGSIRHPPASWPYITGDIQWRTRRFTYGTVTVRAKFPAQAAGLWPAIWLLGANCQNTNLHTADVGYETCPDLHAADYVEVDMVECDLQNWCQLALANFANTGSGGRDFPTCGFPIDTRFHVFTLTWTVSAVTVEVDGHPTGCSYRSPAWTIPSTPMFLIIQTQTGGVGGTPIDGLLPASLQVDFVKVTQP